MSQRKTMFCTGLCNKVLMTSVGYVSGSALVVAPALVEGIIWNLARQQES